MNIEDVGRLIKETLRNVDRQAEGLLESSAEPIIKGLLARGGQLALAELARRLEHAATTERLEKQLAEHKAKLQPEVEAPPQDFRPKCQYKVIPSDAGIGEPWDFRRCKRNARPDCYCRQHTPATPTLVKKEKSA